ncbi:MAG: hypothetical protein VB039_05270 [Oscillospiraceae bacterium]|nr:hypothetical protein [Oscillospiraceae bacterium]
MPRTIRRLTVGAAALGVMAANCEILGEIALLTLGIWAIAQIIKACEERDREHEQNADTP